MVSKDSFGDLRRAAEAIRADGFQGRVLATDYKAKQTSFYAGGEVQVYSRRRVNPGDRVLLNSFSTSKKRLARERAWLERNFEVHTIAHTRERHMQFFADDISEHWRTNGKVHHVLDHWLRWFKCESVAIRIGPRN